MNYDIATTADQIKLTGIKVAFDRVGTQLKAVYFRDSDGNVCRVALDSYNLTVNIPAGPKMGKRYILRGELPVVGKIEKQFDHQYEADAERRELEGKFRDELDLTVTHEEVEIEPASSASDIPF